MLSGDQTVVIIFGHDHRRAPHSTNSKNRHKKQASTEKVKHQIIYQRKECKRLVGLSVLSD